MNIRFTMSSNLFIFDLFYFSLRTNDAVDLFFLIFNIKIYPGNNSRLIKYKALRFIKLFEIAGDIINECQSSLHY